MKLFEMHLERQPFFFKTTEQNIFALQNFDHPVMFLHSCFAQTWKKIIEFVEFSLAWH